MYRIDVAEDCNPMGNMHGGRIAAIVDSTTSLVAEVARPGRTTVTMDLSVSYLKGIDCQKVENVVIESMLEGGGRKICFTSCKIKSSDESVTYALGRQTQMMVPDEHALFKPEDFE